MVRLRGLPWSASAAEVIDFLRDVTVKNGEKGVHLTQQPDGRSTGEAYVEIETEVDKAKALNLSGEYIGRRYIEVYDSSYSLMERELNPSATGAYGADGGVVRLRGLPYGTTESDVSVFFSGNGDCVEDTLLVSSVCACAVYGWAGGCTVQNLTH